MDTSKEYTKMCGCPRIQRKWIPEEGDFYIPFGEDYVKGYGSVDTVSGVRAIKEEKRREYLTGTIYERLVWLPCQHQIQEMLDYGLGALVNDFNEFCEEDLKMYGDSTRFYDYKSMEQLWLAFYMYEKHKRKWNGEKWVR